MIFDYDSYKRTGLYLFLLQALIITPGVPLVSKFLSLNSISSALMASVMAGYSGILFLLLGEGLQVNKSDREPIYHRFLKKPSFYYMTVLKAFSFYAYFQAISFLPAALLTMLMILSPLIIFNLRRFYRPKSLDSNVNRFMIVGAPSIYLAIFGLSLPSFGSSSEVVIGLVWGLTALMSSSVYQIEKETAANDTGDWLGSLRFGGLHRVLIAALFIPFVGISSFLEPMYIYNVENLGLVLLAVFGGLGWFIGLHITRLLNAYYASYIQLTKTAIVTAAEGLLLGVWLSGYQYLGAIGTLIVFFVVYREVKTS